MNMEITEYIEKNLEGRLPKLSYSVIELDKSNRYTLSLIHI